MAKPSSRRFLSRCRAGARYSKFLPRNELCGVANPLLSGTARVCACSAARACRNHGGVAHIQLVGTIEPRLHFRQLEEERATTGAMLAAGVLGMGAVLVSAVARNRAAAIGLLLASLIDLLGAVCRHARAKREAATLLARLSRPGSPKH